MWKKKSFSLLNKTEQNKSFSINLEISELH